MYSFLDKKEGPCIILAGAGTGKTRAIVEKNVSLIQNNIFKPEEIVCLTFSNEAARSMEARITYSLESKNISNMPKVRTFHGLCADLLKEHGDRIGISKDFRIIEPRDSIISLHKNLKVPAHLCSNFIETISSMKDLGISMSEYEAFLNEQRKSFPEDVKAELETASFQLRTMHAREAQIEKSSLLHKVESLSTFMKRSKLLESWRAYEKLKIKKNVQDYSDLNANALILLEKHPEIVKDIKYVIVDEFQDTNKVQLDLIKILAHKNNITIVGDMNQSIYRFRGAYKDNLELFKNHFKVNNTEIFNLDKSHRSPNTVLRLANKIISKNYNSDEKIFDIVNAYDKDGEKIKIYEMKNGKEEVRKILEIIKLEIDKGRKPEDICVMFRTHQQANILKKSLEHDKIAYHSALRKPLLKHHIIKQLINYLSIINSIIKKVPSLNAWWDLIHESKFSSEDEISLSNFLRKNREEKDLSSQMLQLNIALTEEGKIIFSSLIARINSLAHLADKQIPQIIEESYKLFPITELEKTKEGRESLLALQEFKKIINEQNNHEFFDLPTFLYHIEIIKSLQLEFETPSLEESGIKIMTAHATKGLEYPVVIIANLAQKKFPIERFNSNSLIPAEIMPELKNALSQAPSYLKEELRKEYEHEQLIKDERRLCYVACTRAKEKLYLTYAQEYSEKPHSPSQFLAEADYKKNSDVVFEQDLKEMYQEPLPTINKIPIPNKKEINFSPSSLKLFLECQKKYEYKYVLNMPDEKPVSWEAINLGSFVHAIIEHGVRANYRDEKLFILFAREEALKPEWESIDLNEAILLIKVFFERNKNKYNANSLCEQHLHLNLNGIKFHGIADRIDLHEDGAEIIDYKTGAMQIPFLERNWQLGIYALAASQIYGPVKRVTLDMLKHDRPLEFDLNENGIAIERNTKRMSFNLQEIENQLVDTAKSILACYKSGFKPCQIEKNCAFCDEYVWNK